MPYSLVIGELQFCKNLRLQGQRSAPWTRRNSPSSPQISRMTRSCATIGALIAWAPDVALTRDINYRFNVRCLCPETASQIVAKYVYRIKRQPGNRLIYLPAASESGTRLWGKWVCINSWRSILSGVWFPGLKIINNPFRNEPLNPWIVIANRNEQITFMKISFRSLQP